MANNGKFYEELIYRYLYSKSFRVEEDIYGESYVNELFYVHKDVRINSAKTSNTRQVDILINKKNNCRIAVECKDYSTPIDTPHLEAFVSKCNSLNVNQGYFYSASGFTVNATEYAKNSMGIHLFHIPISNLLYLLTREYDFHLPFFYSCPICKDGIDSGIDAEYVYHVLTEEKYYFQVYMGLCKNCFNYFCIDSISHTPTLVAKLDNQYSLHFLNTPIICSENPKIKYDFDCNGSLCVMYNNTYCTTYEEW